MEKTILLWSSKASTWQDPTGSLETWCFRSTSRWQFIRTRVQHQQSGVCAETRGRTYASFKANSTAHLLLVPVSFSSLPLCVHDEWKKPSLIQRRRSYSTDRPLLLQRLRCSNLPWELWRQQWQAGSPQYNCKLLSRGIGGRQKQPTGQHQWPQVVHECERQLGQALFLCNICVVF